MSDTQEYFVSLTATQKEIDEANKLDEGAYANYSQKGSAYLPNYNRSPLDDIGWQLNQPQDKSTPKSTNLFEQMKNGSDTLSKAFIELAKVQHNQNKILERQAQATENMGLSLLQGILTVATELTKGNKYNSVLSKINNTVAKTQVQKNIEQAKYYNFMNDGKPELVDSQGNPIKPLEATAKANAENAISNHFNNTGELNNSQVIDSSGKKVIPLEATARSNAENAISKSLDNRMPYGDLVDNDDFLTDSDNIMNKVVQDLLNVDITKIDDIDNKGVKNV